MGSLNSVQLIGNLGKDAELRYTQGGTAVTSFSLATTDKWTDKDGNRQEKTEWHNIVLWGKTAEALNEYLKKGKQIYVGGSLTTRSYEKDGVKKYITEIKAHNIVLLGGGGGGGERSESSGRRPRQAAPEPEPSDASPTASWPPREEPPLSEDDIPF